MKKLLIIVLALVIIGFLVNHFYFKDDATKETIKEEPVQPITVNKKHSTEFNLQVDSIINNYLAMKEALVEADIPTTKAATTAFINAVDRLNIAELDKNNTTISQTAKATMADVRSNAESMLKQNDITEIRRDFSSLTQMLYPTFFQTIGYEGQKLYLQNCPMAFNDTEEASWLSNNAEIVNPYLGKTHPKYKASMLHCGEVKDSIILKP